MNQVINFFVASDTNEVAKALDNALAFVPQIFGGDKNTIIFFTIVFVFILMYAILLAVFSTPMFKHVFQNSSGGINKQAKVAAFSLAGIAILALFVSKSVSDLTNNVTQLLGGLNTTLTLLFAAGGFFLIFFLFQAFEPKDEDKAGLASFLGAVFGISFIIINTPNSPTAQGFAYLALMAVVGIGLFVKFAGHESPTLPRPGFGRVDKTHANDLIAKVKQARTDKENIPGHATANQNVFDTIIAKQVSLETKVSKATTVAELSKLESKLRNLKKEFENFVWA